MLFVDLPLHALYDSIRMRGLFELIPEHGDLGLVVLGDVCYCRLIGGYIGDYIRGELVGDLVEHGLEHFHHIINQIVSVAH